MMRDSENVDTTMKLALADAVESFIATRLAVADASLALEAPEEAQIWGPIASLMGLSKAERQGRRREILDAFAPAWATAGGVPRLISPKKARVAKRKQTLKQIKNQRAQVAKIAAANQKRPIAPASILKP